MPALLVLKYIQTNKLKNKTKTQNQNQKQKNYVKGITRSFSLTHCERNHRKNFPRAHPILLPS